MSEPHTSELNGNVCVCVCVVCVVCVCVCVSIEDFFLVMGW